MSTYPYPMLERPFVEFRKAEGKPFRNVSEWIQTLPPSGEYRFENYDAVILGIPLSRSSISASAASEAPNALRSAWKYFSTYHIEADVELNGMGILDIGDVKQSITDIAASYKAIREVMYAMRMNHPHTLPICLGGDHSVTARLVQGWKKAHPEQTIGLLQFDTHFDLRSLDEGPTNGTPMRLLIEEGIVKGEHIHTLGVHGFFNSQALKHYADQSGVTYKTMTQMRKYGISRTVKESLDALSEDVDIIYVTVDMDVLDVAFAPGAPAATPGGMRTDELFEAVFLAGQASKAASMDIVCLDPRLDVREATIKAGVHVMLCFLSGYWDRKQKEMSID
ncbi:agmatinase family protein [Pseudalkalibacillus hwajinpoensis]|uniref:agmatinase family protein n=1 Tax=Guptibacillus hwajinpoensis TaxID=208199 RepID=UPI00325A5224